MKKTRKTKQGRGALIQEGIRSAVSHYWHTRRLQQQKQSGGKVVDHGLRSAVTGGAQMDGFVSLFRDLLLEAGICDDCVFTKKSVEIPGFFRPTKEWDLLVVQNGKLVVALELKSQAGPSFGNNFNNRVEEAIGSALDLWTAYREGAYQASPQPFVGYLFLLEECQSSTRPVSVREPHFSVFSEFESASYLKRYEIFCRRLVLERHYSAAAFLTSDRVNGLNGECRTPSQDLSVEGFIKALLGRVCTMD